MGAFAAWYWKRVSCKSPVLAHRGHSKLSTIEGVGAQCSGKEQDCGIMAWGGWGNTGDMSGWCLEEECQDRTPWSLSPLVPQPCICMSMSISMSMSLHCHKPAAFAALSFTLSSSLQLHIQPLLLHGHTQQVIHAHPAYSQPGSELQPGTRGEEGGCAGLSLPGAGLLLPSARGEGPCGSGAADGKELSRCRRATAVVMAPSPALPAVPRLLALGQQVPSGWEQALPSIPYSCRVSPGRRLLP